jgi:hypothetical protein
VKRDHVLTLLAVALGAAIWIAIATLTGKREAWDSELYFKLGVPVTCVVSFVFGLIEPARSWRWGVAPFAGQFLAMLLTEGVGSLLPLGMIAFAVLSIPAVITARIGAAVGKRRAS